MVEDSHSECLCLIGLFEFEDRRITDEVHDNECSNPDNKTNGCHKDEDNNKRSLNILINTSKLYLVPMRFVDCPLKTRGLF